MALSATEPATADSRSGGVSIPGRVGRVNGSMVGGNLIYNDSKLVASLQRKLLKEARELGIKKGAIIELARRARAEIGNFHQAMTELRNLVEIAIKVQKEGSQPSNLSGFVDDVLRRRAELNRGDRYEDAAGVVDDALVPSRLRFQQYQAEHLRLLDAGIDSDRLARRPSAAADKIAERITLETPDPVRRLKTLFEHQHESYQRGSQCGLIFDLEMALALARIAKPLATTLIERFQCRVAEGNALAAIGEMRKDVARLHTALAAYENGIDSLGGRKEVERLAQLLRTKDNESRPVDINEVAFEVLHFMDRYRTTRRCAHAYINIANVRNMLAAWEKDATHARLAIDYLDEATKLVAADAMTPDMLLPIDIARSNSYSTLAELTDDPVHHVEAARVTIAGLRATRRDPQPPPRPAPTPEIGDRQRAELTTRATARATLRNNLGTALWRLGEQKRSERRLRQAVMQLRKAASPELRAIDPVRWASFEQNLAGALARLGANRRDVDTLLAAIRAYEEAKHAIGGAEHVQLAGTIEANLALVRADLAALTQAL